MSLTVDRDKKPTSLESKKSLADASGGFVSVICYTLEKGLLLESILLTLSRSHSFQAAAAPYLPFLLNGSLVFRKSPGTVAPRICPS